MPPSRPRRARVRDARRCARHAHSGRRRSIRRLIAGNTRSCERPWRNDSARSAEQRGRLSRALLQFGDSMFPIGGFSFSGGLESAIQKGVVADAATLHAFARTAVEQAARGDGIALICAHRAADAGDVDALDPNRRAGVRPQALERDANDVGAHGQEVHGNGCRR